MGYSEYNCPHCGRVNREKCNAWMYGSPIRTCKNCNQKYVDKRYREVAIEGFDARSVNPTIYLKGIAFFAIFLLICSAMLAYQILFRGYYMVRLVACVVIGVFGILMCGILFVRIKMGLEDKKNEMYLEESEKRLADKSYVQELLDNGYDVPEKYLLTREPNV